ncbi:MAG: hypothetical protein H0X25_20385 [Acidobacteriales bacterium]|nr:hypothetical protein [Terriglobales bacterium]
MRKLAVTVVVLLGLSIVASTQDYPRFVAKLALKNQTADIPVTTLFTPKVDSFYRVSTYLVVAIPGGKDNDSRWLGQVLYTDDAGPETGPGESVTSLRQGFLPYGESTTTISATAGIPVTYTVTGQQDSGAGGVYEFYVTVERLQ